jgi:hypothetical protein
LLLALVAFASSGNVVIHRIAYWHNCHCYEAIPADVFDSGCVCGHDHAQRAATDQDGSRVASDADCLIGDFFRQSADPSVATPSVQWDATGAQFLCVDAIAVDASILRAYWSRGPPANG